MAKVNIVVSWRLQNTYVLPMLLHLQILLLLTPVQLVTLSLKGTMSLFIATQVVILYQTSRGQNMAAQQYCIKERHTAFLMCRDKLLEITRVHLGMEWVKRPMLQLLLLYTVSFHGLTCTLNLYIQLIVVALLWSPHITQHL